MRKKCDKMRKNALIRKNGKKCAKMRKNVEKCAAHSPPLLISCFQLLDPFVCVDVRPFAPCFLK